MFNPDRDREWPGPDEPVPKNDLIQPAFASRAQALFFVCAVTAALITPAVIGLLGFVSREDSYDLVPPKHGAFSFAKSEIFDVPDDIDLLFVGSSVLFAGVNTPQVQKELSLSLGRETRVRTFGHYFNSFDVTYMQVADLLEQKRVKMIALSVPRMEYTDGPSPLAHWFMRYGESAEVMTDLPWRDHAALYAGSILRAPRDLLTALRPERVPASKWANTLGADITENGMNRDPGAYVRFDPQPPVLPAASMIYSTGSRDGIEITGDQISRYQFQYFEHLIALTRRHGVPVVIINIPQLTEAQNGRLVERRDWSASLGTEIPLIGVPPTVLFSGLTGKEIETLYSDRLHFNVNGNKLYTRTVLPAIIEVYKEHAKEN